ncbi:putative nucleolar ATPase Kre33 [Thamnocephalis sphaerospora]|uniref:RNA cytidine acetyltransferase n=1 Tax=Thamnocephalis sphaerospora TaxID=78915 RepID=A0A4P9XWA7_9FUNG|nr:putative nucleolar ATPase Kre33 [Thamnocephalis sphaerospora]|eukprot:RKP09881.1 putative nucleolar ATPase Kre33 [Thamnocephalis sphaerospora]
MVRKAIDSRIHTLVKNGVQQKHRTFFVMVGDRGRDQVVNLHWLLSQTRVASRPSVLWCYKKDLGFTSHRKKREAKIKKEIKRGVREPNEEDPFELFISVTDIRYTYYKETHKVLGQTFGMCVLQDFEALTPNLLARTIETVEGGGIVVLLLRTMSSLRQLYTMTMDVHSRYRTEAHDDVTARFNERFILSLGSCENCLVLDDELNVLPISLGRNTKPLPPAKPDEVPEHVRELKELKESLADTQPVGALVNSARTLDQARAILTFVEAISEKTLRSTVTLTASRGRGKSAALGIAIAAAVAHGYSNIFVTSPSPENLKTLFEFIFKGFDALNYEEHLDYDIVQSTNPDFNKAIVRVNVFRDHRQTIQYIQPQDAHTLSQAELLVIDEAAAIPLPLVRKLLGPFLVFMASTVNGYEGTGRSLSLKLIQQLREQSRGFVGRDDLSHVTRDGNLVGRDGKARKDASGAAAGGRTLREIMLDEPIRYAPNDPIERWMNQLLCLDASVVNKTLQGCPHPDQCELYRVHRDTLFSYHPVSEAFLQKMMALYVASHYKNSPNDLQLMSDAPAHELYVLLPPVAEGARGLPDPLCVIQVCLEGQISRESVMHSLRRGQRASGDLIPWLVSQQFQDDDFASLSGARVVRIATHPDYVKMGYGARALALLGQFYEGRFQDLSEAGADALIDPEAGVKRVDNAELEHADLHTDQVRVRDPARMPPLLLKLSQIKGNRLHWLGVSYGLTASLHKFWKRAGFAPVYLRQTPNELTGEHTCVMLRDLRAADLPTQCSPEWLGAFSADFRRRFLALLAYQFRTFHASLALGIMEAADQGTTASGATLRRQLLARGDLDRDLSPYDLKRLESYANHQLDYHVVLDLVPRLSEWLFERRMDPEAVHLSGVQSAILLAIGLQKKSIDDLEQEFGLPSSQVLAMFVKVLRKCSAYFRDILAQAVDAELPAVDGGKKTKNSDVDESSSKAQPRSLTDDAAWQPLEETLDDDLDEEGRAQMRAVREKQRAMLDAMDLSQYSIADGQSGPTATAAWADAEAMVQAGKGASVVSVVRDPSSSKKSRKTPAAPGSIVATVIKEGEQELKRAIAANKSRGRKKRKTT